MLDIKITCEGVETAVKNGINDCYREVRVKKADVKKEAKVDSLRMRKTLQRLTKAVITIRARDKTEHLTHGKL